MRVVFLLVLTAFASGCAAIRTNGGFYYTPKGDPVSPEKRFLEYTVQTKLSKSEAYSKAKQWVAKKYSAGSGTMKYDDKAEGVFIDTFVAKCEIEDGQDERDVQTPFLLEFRASKNKVFLKFSNFDRGFRNHPGRTTGELKSIEDDCILPTKQSLVDELK